MAVTTQEKKYASAHPDEKTGLGKKIMNLSGQGLVYTILIVGAILFTAPWVWMISASFQPRVTCSTGRPLGGRNISL